MPPGLICPHPLKMFSLHYLSKPHFLSNLSYTTNPFLFKTHILNFSQNPHFHINTDNKYLILFFFQKPTHCQAHILVSSRVFPKSHFSFFISFSFQKNLIFPYQNHFDSKTPKRKPMNNYMTPNSMNRNTHNPKTPK